MERYDDPVQYKEYLHVAAKLKLDDTKLAARPGPYTFLHTTPVHEISPPIPKEMTPKQETAPVQVKEEKPRAISAWKQDNLPQDLTIVVSDPKKESKKIFKTNKAICCCFMRGFERLLEKKTVHQGDRSFLLLSDLDPDALVAGLTGLCNRDDSDSNGCEEFWEIWEVFQAHWETEEPPQKKVRVEHETGLKAMDDPKWLDATFLCGIQKERSRSIERASLLSIKC